ncbi:MAG: DUF1572 family protein [Gemmatimonadota bacterium]
MSDSIGARFLAQAVLEFKDMQATADRAVAQISDAELTRSPDPETNSIAVTMRHIAGNQRSRWRDFLTSDGEKLDRNRDGEFELPSGLDRARLLADWRAGWDTLYSALEPLTPGHLDQTVTIRGQSLTVLQAILRQLKHYSYHVGQIVLLAKHYAGDRWETLTMPRRRAGPGPGA